MTNYVIQSYIIYDITLNASLNDVIVVLILPCVYINIDGVACNDISEFQNLLLLRP